MAVADTSAETYHTLKADGTMTRQQKAIVDLLRPGRDYSLQELISITGFPVNVLSPRCLELRELGVLELGPTRPCSRTGRSIHPVRLAEVGSPAQGGLFS